MSLSTLDRPAAPLVGGRHDHGHTNNPDNYKNIIIRHHSHSALWPVSSTRRSTDDHTNSNGYHRSRSDSNSSGSSGSNSSSSNSSNSASSGSLVSFPYSGPARYLGSMGTHSSRTHPYSVRSPGSSSSSLPSSSASPLIHHRSMNAGHHPQPSSHRHSLPLPARRKDDARPPPPSSSSSQDTTSMDVEEEMMIIDSPTNRTAATATTAPMPSLTSHPPLRLQRRPVVGTRLRELQGSSSLVDEQQESLLDANHPSPSPPTSHPPHSPTGPTNHHHNEMGSLSHHPSSSQHHYTTSSGGDSAMMMTMMMGPSSTHPGTIVGAEEATFPCPFCPAVFRKVGHLNRHTLKHTGTRFACEVAGCEKTFSRLDNMRTHMKNMHPNVITDSMSSSSPPPTVSSAPIVGSARSRTSTLTPSPSLSRPDVIFSPSPRPQTGSSSSYSSTSSSVAAATAAPIGGYHSHPPSF
ncbi:hypothetical protein FRC17_001376 [Serendipita sp. 399]|nr:hypothetical protein FRC17_001376 [Serendipita sp. 399]